MRAKISPHPLGANYGFVYGTQQPLAPMWMSNPSMYSSMFGQHGGVNPQSLSVGFQKENCGTKALKALYENLLATLQVQGRTLSQDNKGQMDNLFQQLGNIESSIMKMEELLEQAAAKLQREGDRKVEEVNVETLSELVNKHNRLLTKKQTGYLGVIDFIENLQRAIQNNTISITATASTSIKPSPLPVDPRLKPLPVNV